MNRTSSKNNGNEHSLVEKQNTQCFSMTLLKLGKSKLKLKREGQKTFTIKMEREGSRGKGNKKVGKYVSR